MKPKEKKIVEQVVSKTKYDFTKIERKWQDKWANEKSFKAIDFHPTKPKY